MPSATLPASALRGTFITLEGVDGCGKSTQAALLAERLERAGLPVVRTREPGGTPAGQALRRVLLDPAYRGLAPEAELLLFLADRVQHLRELIQPALARGDIVVCDRFHDATVAFQHHARGLDFATVQPWIERHVRPMPDVTLWIDVDVATATQRLRARASGAASPTAGAPTRLDQEPAAFHQRVRDGYAAIAAAEPQRVLRVDGTPPTGAVHEAIWAALASRFAV